MLDVTGCTCPTGLLWRGVYDATGVQYRVPEWVVVEPEGLEDEDNQDHGGAATGPASAGAQVDTAPNLDDDEHDVKLVRARTSHNQKDLVLSVRRKEPVVSIIEKLKKQAEVHPTPWLNKVPVFF